MSPLSYLGVVASFATVVSYIVRYSLIRGLSDSGIDRYRLNAYYRFFSLPFLILIILLTGGFFIPEYKLFLLPLSVSLLLNIAYGAIQVKIYQKFDFSLITMSRTLDVLFSFVLGFIFLAEKIYIHHVLGFLLLLVSYIVLAWDKRVRVDVIKVAGLLVVYNLIGSFTSVANKFSINNSSPQMFALFLTVLLVVSNYAISWVKSEGIVAGVRDKNFPFNRFFLMGAVVAGGFLCINFAFKYLNIGVVTAILATEPFVALIVSKYKYKEENLLPKLFASIIAFAGVLIMVLPK